MNPNTLGKACRLDVDDGERTTSWRVEGNQFTLGRAPDNDGVIHSAHASRHHAVIQRTAAGMTIMPSFSASRPTSLNGRELDGMARFVPGDEVMLGPIRLRLVDDTDSGAILSPNGIAESSAAEMQTAELMAPELMASEGVAAPPTGTQVMGAEAAADEAADAIAPGDGEAGPGEIGGRSSVMIGEGSRGDEPDAAHPVEPPRRSAPLRWMRRHRPLVAALLIAGVLAALFGLREETAPEAPAAMDLCDAPLVFDDVPPCAGPEACARAAEDAVRAAERHAESRVGAIATPRVLGEAHRARQFAERAGTALDAAVADRARKLFDTHRDRAREQCRAAKFAFAQARTGPGNQQAAADACREIIRLFPHAKDARHMWARRTLARLE